MTSQVTQAIITIVISICILIFLHYDLNVPDIVAKLEASSIEGLTNTVEGLAITSIFVGVALNHLEHATSIFGSIINQERRRRAEHQGFTMKALLLATAALVVSISIALFYKFVASL
jgi:hypothetical protein